MQKRWKVVALVSAVLGLQGCTTTQSTTGTTVFCPITSDEPAVRVKVLDAHTGRSLDLEARGTLIDGDYREVMRFETYDDPTTNKSLKMLIGATERPGNYDVVIEHPGYKSWSAESIPVSINACGNVNSMIFTVYLEPDA